MLACPRCGGRLRLVALIDRDAAIERMLRHLGWPAEIPAPHPARAPPRPVEGADEPGQADQTPVFDPCS